MGLISRATQVSKAIKNMGRFRQIVAAMSRFGFGAVVERVGLRGYSDDNASSDQDLEASRPPVAVRLRMLCEQLGPTFIKIGQLLSGRPDLISEDLIRELERLQDNVSPVSFLALKPTLEEDLGRRLDECFSSFDTEPLATASIAQVHAARTLDGDDVVVKIRKPDVERLLMQDLDILEFLAGLLETYMPELRAMKPKRIVAELRANMLAETNLSLEAQNMRRFRENFAKNSFLYVPKVYLDLSGPRMITMERIRGTKLTNVDEVRALGIDPKAVLAQGVDCFFQSIMVDGFFHADPHGGNMLVLPDGRLGLIDFGSVGRLSQKGKDAIINMFLALISEDYEALVQEYLDLSPPLPGSRTSSTVARLEEEIGSLFKPYHGLPLAEIPSGRLLVQGANLAFRNNVQLPSDLVLVFRSIMILEGLARSLDPQFDLVGGATKFAGVVFRERYAPERVLKEAFFTVKDWSRFMRRAPRRLEETLRQIECGELKLSISIPEIEKQTREQKESFFLLAHAVLAAALIIAAAMITGTGRVHTGVEVSLWLGAVFIFLRGFYSLHF